MGECTLPDLDQSSDIRELSFPIVAEFSLCLVKCILVSQTLSHRIEFVLIMPFIQSGPHATAHITTYNDVAGNQINSTRNITTGNITGAIILRVCIHVLTGVLVQLVKGVMEVTLSQLQGIALEVLEVLEVPEVPSTFPEG